MLSVTGMAVPITATSGKLSVLIMLLDLYLLTSKLVLTCVNLLLSCVMKHHSNVI